MVKEHSENVGFYFYIMIETFQQHVGFFQISYLMFQLMIVSIILILFNRLWTVIELNTKLTKG